MTTILDPNNRLFVLARQGKRLPSALMAIAVVIGMLVLVIACESRARIALRPMGVQSETENAAENILGFLPVYVGMWGWLRLSSKRPFSSLGLKGPGALNNVLRGVFVAGLMMAITAGLVIMLGAEAVRSQTLGMAALGIGFLSLLGYLVQGSAEEVLFRGWLLQVIGARYRPWVGVLVSSVLFSLAHSLSSGVTPLAFFNLFLFGVFAAVYALAEGGLWGIGVWHAVWNWAQGDVLGFSLDGTPHSGLLVSIRATGPDVITGGAFGPEGGLAATAVFLVAIGIVAMMNRGS